MNNENDPFNTPFENWYADQRNDPTSQVSLMSRYLRIFLWCWLGLISLKMLGFFKSRGELRR